MRFDPDKFFAKFRPYFRSIAGKALTTDQVSNLWQMLPCATSYNVSNSAPRYSVILCYLCVRAFIRANSNNIFFRQFSVRRFAVSMATVTNHIVTIFGLCATSQMVRITARRVVTLIMTNCLISYIFAGCSCIHQAVSQPVVTGVKNPTITTLVDSAFPKPAVIRFFDIFHQAPNRRAATLGLLVARIRAIFLALFFGVEQYAASIADKFEINCFGKKFTPVRAEDSLRGAKREKSRLALEANTRFRGANISHLTSIITQRAGYLYV